MEFPRIKYLSQTKTDSMLPLLKYITLLALSQATKYSNRTLNMNVPGGAKKGKVCGELVCKQPSVGGVAAVCTS